MHLLIMTDYPPSSYYYREIVTTAKKTPGVCILFIFLYELDLIDESIRTSKNYKFFILSGLGGIPDDY